MKKLKDTSKEIYQLYENLCYQNNLKPIKYSRNFKILISRLSNENIEELITAFVNNYSTIAFEFNLKPSVVDILTLLNPAVLEYTKNFLKGQSNIPLMLTYNPATLPEATYLIQTKKYHLLKDYDKDTIISACYSLGLDYVEILAEVEKYGNKWTYW